MENRKLTYDEVLTTLEGLATPSKMEELSQKIPCLIDRYSPFHETRYLAFRYVIQSAIAVLHKENKTLAQILVKHFLDDHYIHEISGGFFVEKRQFQKLQRKAILRLTDILDEQENNCRNEQSTSCGDNGVDLSYRLPLISSAFGSYFTGLLEATDNYCYLADQLEFEAMDETRLLPPLIRVQHSLRKPKGPLMLLIGGVGGIGKTILATKILKCLLNEHDADRILGGSAKTEYVDVISQEIRSIESDFSNPGAFYRKLHVQLGLPKTTAAEQPERLSHLIRQWMRDQNLRTVIVLDNLDNLDSHSMKQVIHLLHPLLNRDCRAIITTRYLAELPRNAAQVTIRPLTDTDEVRRFLQWHIKFYSGQQKTLDTLEIDDDKIKLLIERTGGIPLLFQLVLSTVVLLGWSYLQRPMPFGAELYDFLYREHWDALANGDETAQSALQLARYIVKRQAQGKRTAWSDIEEWSKFGNAANIVTAMQILSDRFLVLNRDMVNGDFVTFPSFADFVLTRVQK